MLKKAVRDFISQEEGIETIEFLGLIAVAIALLVIVKLVGDATKKKVEDASSYIG